ncbi:STAS/SEC14 domain-containing protein [Pseudenhygromyxa sp. WMMC2535]|uniref:STAS/SEC14 domain-containing protein n=1 Tax=Pseudenhygromyxa sp. WMMC2535 TaxID=2712867 RepID=UPI001557D395|nr:STAS/SEC14 domain-containing protein [Pseudenhygromyxa sp. WMMC2535]NVB40846.1 STAS/SEC14 domain-containing protein [Pseudenhygromyxa sp. WMMC2535]
MHFSQVPSAVNSNLEPSAGSRGELLRIELQGLIDATMLRERFEALEQRLTRQPPPRVLCDLRDMAGYGSGTPTVARECLALAQRSGVRRVALIVTSSVLRTAVRVIASGLELELRSFLGETEALRWLESGEPAPRLN